MIHGGQEPKLNTTHSISPPCPLPMPTSALDVTLDLPTQLVSKPRPRVLLPEPHFTIPQPQLSSYIAHSDCIDSNRVLNHVVRDSIVHPKTTIAPLGDCSTSPKLTFPPYESHLGRQRLTPSIQTTSKLEPCLLKSSKMALTNAATVKWKNETVASTGRHVSTNFPNKSNSASHPDPTQGSHTKDSHINAPVWVARTSQIRQTHASTPTSLSYTPPDHDKLIRERDALEEELLLRYMQLRKMEQRFSLELEYRDRELEAIKLNVATARGANPASSNK
ncbi:hypothetical protein BSLG_007751 [Batrachochytrium salamandrivorans]|nr:hypothetical protein BSLG_007751 [Batrachochytrium salamandrivorans]